MAMQVYNTSGKTNETVTIDLPKKDLSPKTYACAVKVLRQNWRQGTVASKGRGEVAFSGKKPWKQKGTGRARVGAKSSPLWRKGGVIFGPQPRTRTLKLNKQQRVHVFNNVFHSLHDVGNISCLDFNAGEKPSVKNALNALKAMGIDKKKVVLFVNPADLNAALSFRNLSNVRVISFDQPNAFEVTHCDNWVFLKKDVESFKSMVSRWN